MKNKGFIKLYRNVLSKPEMTDLVAKHGAEGFGVYIMLMIYLSQCDDYEGPFTNGLLSSIAVQAHKSRKYVRHIACDFQLFEINGKRFRAASGFGQDSIRNESKTQNSPARTNRYAGEDIEIDIEKEKKEKCVRRKGTHSEFETLRAGRRYASHGQPLPADAPPQRRRNDMYSYIRHDWVPAEEFEKSAEMIVFHQLFNDDTV